MKTSQPTLDLRSYQREVQRHHHDYHQLVLPVEGCLAMSVGNRQGQVTSHQAAFIAAGEEHSFAAPELNRFVVADIPVAMALSMQRLPAFIQLDLTLSHYAAFLYQHLQLETLKQQNTADLSLAAGQSVAKTSSQTTMLMLLVQLLSERFGGQVQVDKRVAAAKQWMDEHYRQSVSLSEVAGVAHLSERQLNHLFKQYYAQTPHQYLTSLRMQQARYLLESTPLSVQQIAEQVGYTSLAAFSDRYRHFYGRSPRHYRSSLSD